MNTLTKRERNISLIVIALLVLLFAAFVAFSVVKDSVYIGQYRLDACDKTIYEHNDSGNDIHYDSTYNTEYTVFYFDTNTFDKKDIDKTINAFENFKTLFTEHDLTEFPDIVYASAKTVFDSWTDNDGSATFSMPYITAEEEVLAWLLYFYSINDTQSLPFGLYAGVSSYLLQISKYMFFDAADIGVAKYLTELQFPTYEQNNLLEQERDVAWSFSTHVVNSMIADGKTVSDILKTPSNVFDLWLYERLGITLPSYEFEPFSKRYEYKIKQGCFTYYVNKEYVDLVLPQSSFSTAYDKLSDWLKDNDKTTKESNAVFGISNMYPITVYLENGTSSAGITGRATEDYIELFSVGSFSHEYIHHILFYTGKSGALREVIPEMHANSSKYAMAMWYYLFSGKATLFPYNAAVNEKETYLTTLNLYSKLSDKEPSADKFDFWFFADCYSAIYTNIGTPFASRTQPDSLARYIARVYGEDYIWQLNLNTDIVIDGKLYQTVVNEWYNYVKSLIA